MLNDIKDSKEKEERADIYKDETKENEKVKFEPSLTSPKEEKTKTFSPKLTKSDIEVKRFKPTLENPKESKSHFKPSLDSDSKEKVKNFTPIQEKPEKNERSIKPTLSIKEKNQLISKDNASIPKLSPKLVEYAKYAKNVGKDKLPNPYPNRGIRITDKFKNWIKQNESDPSTIKNLLNQVENINNGKIIQEMIKKEITTTNKSLKEITRNLKDFGLNMSPFTVKNIAQNHIYNNDSAKFSERFPSGTGGFLQENYSLDKRNMTFDNIQLLKEKFIQYHEFAKKNNFQTRYANRGAKITNQFIKWIRDNEKDISIRNQLINAAKAITKNGEIPQIVMDRTINTSLSLYDISKEIRKKGIYVSGHAIADYSLDHVYKGDIVQYNNRFPKPTDIISEKEEKNIVNFIKQELNEGNIKSIRKIAEQFDRSRGAIKRISRDNLSAKDLNKIWIPNKDKISKDKIVKIKQEVQKHYPKSIRELKKTFDVSEKAITRIAKEENSKGEYERKWPAHEKILQKIRNAVIRDIKKTDLNQGEIADKYSITRHSVRRIAKDKIYKNSEKEFRERFPQDHFLELGTETHNCVIDELTRFFEQNHDTRFYSEPKIYPGYPNKAADGLILNDEEFLQKRLQDPNNINDISKIIHDIPSNSLKDQFDNIKAIQFDFTNNIIDENIIEKSLKYQNPDTMLYIVGTKWYPYDSVKNLPKHEGILYPNNIKVISHDLFAEFIGLKTDALENYEHIIDLNYNGDISTLKRIHESNQVGWNNSGALRKDLLEKKLIRKSIHEYFQIPKKSDKKQKKLF
jgi:hypothetical protein